MSDLREELESKFASADENQQSEQEQAGEQTSPQPTPETTEVDEWLEAPVSYKSEYRDGFKSLPLNFRKYIHERENEASKKLSQMGNQIKGYEFVDNLYNPSAEMLKQNGINSAQEYFSRLVEIDRALAQNPAEVLAQIAKGFNVGLPNDVSADKFKDYDAKLQEISSYITNFQQEQVNKSVKDFIEAKNETGELLHPYFNDVREDMLNLVKSGASQDLNDAYSKAIWINENVRNKMLAEKTQSDLASKVEEAKKAKNASFTVKSKTEGIKTPVSTREELMRRFEDAGL